MQSSEKQDRNVQSQVPVSEGMQALPRSQPAVDGEADEIEIIIQEDGTVVCPNPTYWHAYALDMIPLEIALANDGSEWTCG